MATVDSLRREAGAVFCSANAPSWDPANLTEWQAAAYLRGQRHRGNSVPQRTYRAFVQERCFEINVDSDSSLVKSQKEPCKSDVQAGLKLPEQAQCSTIDMLKGMEHINEHWDRYASGNAGDMYEDDDDFFATWEYEVNAYNVVYSTMKPLFA